MPRNAPRSRPSSTPSSTCTSSAAASISSNGTPRKNSPRSAARSSRRRPEALPGRFPVAVDWAAKHPDPIASRFLGFVEGLIGGAQESLRVGRMGRTQRDPERSGDAAQQLRLARDGRADLRAPAARALERRLGKHQRAPLAARATGDVAAAELTFQKRAHFDEHLVACLVAGAVVDLLETVQIHHDQRKGCALALRADQLPLQIVLQEPPVFEGSPPVPDPPPPPV